MPNTYKKIASVTVGSGGAASIDFTSIPQTYTDLKIVLSLRGTRANLINETGIQFNGVTSSIYNYRVLRGNGASADGFNGGAGQVYAYGGINPAASSTASVFGNAEIYIPNYTSANNKSFSVDAVHETNGTTAYQILSADIFNNTAAITSIKFYSLDSDNFAQYSTATLYGIGDVTASKFAKATGGVITYDANYVYHTYPYSGNFTPNTALTVDYLVVAGGGGGGTGFAGQDIGGGGGAGGLRSTVGTTGGGGSLESPLSLSSGSTYTVTIGSGGASNTNGSNSVFSSITSTGGGKGAGNNSTANGAIGGSGGGGRGTGLATGVTGGAGTTNQGYAGGTGDVGTGNAYGGGGGGGTFAVGSNGSGTFGGNGGAGVTTSISGISTTYSGGGGGGAAAYGGGTFTGGTGGIGGGGNGGFVTTGSAATINTGSGGGGAGSTVGGTFAGGAGGSGIVIIRYPR